MGSSRMSRGVEWMLWRVLHLLFSFVCHLSDCLTRFLGFVAGLKRENCQVREIVTKKPLNVAVVFENQEVVDKDGKIPQLLFWLNSANVSHVTLYDAQGVLKQSEGNLQKIANTLEIKNNKIHSLSDNQAELLSELNGSQYFREVLFTNKKTISVENCDKLLQNGLSNLRMRTSIVSPVTDVVGVEPASNVAEVGHMKVELLSLQDGKGSLVRAARHVCENAYKLHYAEQSTKGTKLTEEDIDKSLRETGSEGPDPDLLLLFGMTRSLLGFPPWRLRLTEIVHMGSLKDLSTPSFVSALNEFSKKQHRYGK